MLSEICHIASSHKKSLKLLKNVIILSCFLNEYVLKDERIIYVINITIRLAGWKS